VVTAAACTAVALALPTLAGAARPERPPDVQRGQIVSVTKVATLPQRRVPSVIRRWREENGLRLATSTVRHGVDAYRLVYGTVGPGGTEPTTASGLVALPRGGAGTGRVVAWEHGTTVAKHDAPSTGRASDARLVSYLFAGSGFVTVAPDYLGLGAGPGRHVFNDRASEVTASVDMLRAARTFVRGKGRAWDDRLLVSGFSQGGKAAIALAGALEAGIDPQLRLRAAAGISGVYDLEHAQTPARSRLDPLGVSFTLAYTAVSWNRVRGLYGRPGEVFRPPYGERMERLFDGHHAQGQIFAALPPRPEQLFRPAFLRLAAHPSGALRQGMEASDGACRYAPRAPTRLYATRGDEQVSFDNTLQCRRDFADHGVRVPVIDLGEHGHFGSEIVAVPRVLEWFRRVG